MRIDYLKCKKAFNRRLHVLAREYEDESVRHTVEAAEYNITEFWRVIKRAREGDSPKIFAINDGTGRIVHNIDEVLEVWRSHFSRLCTPNANPNYDDAHFQYVNNKIHQWMNMRDMDDFVQNPFSQVEIEDAIDRLNSGKAPGIDNITAEHLKFGGPAVFMYPI